MLRPATRVSGKGGSGEQGKHVTHTELAGVAGRWGREVMEKFSRCPVQSVAANAEAVSMDTTVVNKYYIRDSRRKQWSCVPPQTL